MLNIRPFYSNKTSINIAKLYQRGMKVRFSNTLPQNYNSCTALQERNKFNQIFLLFQL